VLHQVPCHKDVWGVEIQIQMFLTLALDGGEWSAPSTYLIGGPRASLDPMVNRNNPCPCHESNLIIQAIAQSLH